MTSILLPTEFREIRLRTGVRLRCLDVGSSDAKPLLLLHGYSDSWFSFSPILPLMPPGLRLIIPDQRGHGDSERPTEGYAPDDLARDAIALLDELDITSVTVVGHSLGSFVAQQMAMLAPERMARLVLVGSAATPRNDNVQSLVPVVQELTDPVDVNFIREFQMSAVYRPVPPTIMERAIAESQKLPARVWRAVLAGMLDRSFVTQLGEIRCPVSVLWGDRDGIFGRADQEELLRSIPGSTLHVFKDVGHTPQWEIPEDFARHLLAEVR